jgi:hypothetical protein
MYNSGLVEIFPVKTVVKEGSCGIFTKAFMLLYTKSYHDYINLISKFHLSSWETSEVEAAIYSSTPSPYMQVNSVNTDPGHECL